MYDDQILNILEARMKIAEKIGLCKKENNVSILQTARWSDIINKMVQKGAGKGLSDKCISEIFQSIHEESINHQINVTRD
jgi:chorismate mutase